jgi:hypothetical protein
MRKTILTLALMVSAGAAWSLNNPFNDFKTATQSDISLFAKDLGGLIGTQDPHMAKLPTLGGFDVGIGMAGQKTTGYSAGLQSIMPSSLLVPMAQAEAGLPFGFSVFLRGIPYNGANFVGGGVRYQLYRSGLLIALPSVALTVAGDSIKQDAFKATHFGGGLQASWDLPIVHPFLGVGLDTTKLTIEQNVNGTLVGANDTGKGGRVNIGLDITPMPFTYLYLAFTGQHGRSGVNGGLGIRFGGIL